MNRIVYNIHCVWFMLLKLQERLLILLVSNVNSSNDIAIYTNIALLIVLYSVGFLFKLPPKRIMGIVGEKVAYNLRINFLIRLMLLVQDLFMKIQKAIFYLD